MMMWIEVGEQNQEIFLGRCMRSENRKIERLMQGYFGKVDSAP